MQAKYRVEMYIEKKSGSVWAHDFTEMKRVIFVLKKAMKRTSRDGLKRRIGSLAHKLIATVKLNQDAKVTVEFTVMGLNLFHSGILNEGMLAGYEKGKGEKKE